MFHRAPAGYVVPNDTPMGVVLVGVFGNLDMGIRRDRRDVD
jgi:hypothetical protein